MNAQPSRASDYCLEHTTKRPGRPNGKAPPPPLGASTSSSPSSPTNNKRWAFKKQRQRQQRPAIGRWSFHRNSPRPSSARFSASGPSLPRPSLSSLQQEQRKRWKQAASNVAKMAATTATATVDAMEKALAVGRKSSHRLMTHALILLKAANIQFYSSPSAQHKREAYKQSILATMRMITDWRSMFTQVRAFLWEVRQEGGLQGVLAETLELQMGSMTDMLRRLHHLYANAESASVFFRSSPLLFKLITVYIFGMIVEVLSVVHYLLLASMSVLSPLLEDVLPNPNEFVIRLWSGCKRSFPLKRFAFTRSSSFSRAFEKQQDDGSNNINNSTEAVDISMMKRLWDSVTNIFLTQHPHSYKPINRSNGNEGGNGLLLSVIGRVGRFLVMPPIVVLQRVVGSWLAHPDRHHNLSSQFLSLTRFILSRTWKRAGVVLDTISQQMTATQAFSPLSTSSSASRPRIELLSGGGATGAFRQDDPLFLSTMGMRRAGKALL